METFSGSVSQRSREWMPRVTQLLHEVRQICVEESPGWCTLKEPARLLPLTTGSRHTAVILRTAHQHHWSDRAVPSHSVALCQVSETVPDQCQSERRCHSGWRHQYPVRKLLCQRIKVTATATTLGGQFSGKTQYCQGIPQWSWVSSVSYWTNWIGSWLAGWVIISNAYLMKQYLRNYSILLTYLLTYIWSWNFAQR